MRDAELRSVAVVEEEVEGMDMTGDEVEVWAGPEMRWGVDVEVE